MTEKFPIKLFEGQVNFIKLLRFHPCAEPFGILAETFLPCVLKMAIDLYLIDDGDIAMREFEKFPRYGSGKPAQRGLRHSYRRERNGQNITRRTVQAVNFVERPFVKGLTTALWWIASPLEKIGFVMMFYSAVDQFFYNWTTLLVRRGYCELPALTGPLTLFATPGAQVASSGGNPISLPNVSQNRASWPHTAFGCSLPPGDYTAIFTASIRNISTTNPATLRLVIKSGTYPIVTGRMEGEPVTIGPGDSATLFCGGDVGSFTFILNGLWWEIETVGSPFFSGDLLASMFQVYQNYQEISY